MARPRKKLKQADINRNSSIKISGVINKIKANERRYTASLVIIFMALFMVIGYFTLKLNIKEYDEIEYMEVLKVDKLLFNKEDLDDPRRENSAFLYKSEKEEI